jgi:hypothetical protein
VGDYVAALVADNLHIVDVSDPAYPVEVGFYEVPGQARRVAAAGNHVYIAAEGILHILDVSDPATPVVATFYDTLEFANDIAVAENHIYIADGGNGLVILNYAIQPY